MEDETTGEETTAETEFLNEWPREVREAPEFIAWNDRRKAELAAVNGCKHGAPRYRGCEQMGDCLWCSECGSLGAMSTTDRGYAGACDPGHQIDLPNDSADGGRGFGWRWEMPRAERMRAAAAAQERVMRRGN